MVKILWFWFWYILRRAHIGDVQQMWDIMSEILLENERMHIPNKVLEINGDTKYKETFSMVIRQKIKKKHNLWKRYMETRLPTVYRNYTVELEIK